MIEERIFCFWTGDNPITPNRIRGLETMRENLGVKIEFLDCHGLDKWILKDQPLHPAYKYLSCNHKSDYLRCYFMHHFGGGYADIKPYSKNNNWKRCFEYINRYEGIEVIGQHDFVGGIAARELKTRIAAEFIVACGWMICRPHSSFTSGWMERVNRMLDDKLQLLRQFPATEPFGGPKYPIEWGGVCGEIFHRWQYEFLKNNKLGVRNVLRTGWLGLDIPYR